MSHTRNMHPEQTTQRLVPFRHWILVATVCAGLAACGRTPVAPGSPADQTDPASPPFDFTMTVTVDSMGSSAAIVSVSDVQFEARAPANTKLRDIRIDFGDGSSAQGGTARHVYSAPGTYLATATLTATSGVQVTTTQQVSVKALAGTWYDATFDSRVRRVAVRRLTLAQEGRTLHGVYRNTGEVDRPVTGSVVDGRRVRLFAGGQVLEGAVPSSVSGEGALWTLRMENGPASGETLTLKPVVGEPSGPDPEAILAVRPVDSYILEGLDARFDASNSKGEGLSYFVEYGDGVHGSEAVSDHAPGLDGRLTARLTVVDRFGRMAVVDQPYEAETLVLRWSYASYHYWMHQMINPANGRWETRQLRFERQEGRHVFGRYRHPEGNFSQFSGTLSGSRDISFILDGGGIEFTGTIPAYPVDGGCYGGHLDLTLRGGSANGQLLVFRVGAY